MSSQTAAGHGASPACPSLPREIERDVGPAYPDAALQAYVDRVGQKLVEPVGRLRQVPLRRARPAGGQCPRRRRTMSSSRAACSPCSMTRPNWRPLSATSWAMSAAPCRPARAAAAGRARRRRRGRDRDRVGHGRPLGGARRPAALRRYSREQELEADRIGVAILVQRRLSRRRHGQPDRQAAPPGAARAAAHGRSARIRSTGAARPRPILRRSSGGPRSRASARPWRRARPTARPISTRSTACRSTIRRRKASCAAIASSIPC